METCFWYKGYVIKYNSMNGTTYVNNCDILKKFIGKGCIDGEKLAKKFIDDMIVSSVKYEDSYENDWLFSEPMFIEG
jgi:hypothetical protein